MSKMLSAKSFAMMLHRAFDAARSEADKTITQAQWSGVMFPLLQAIAKQNGFWWAGKCDGTKPDPTEGQHREYLWDFTMYKPDTRGTWNLPQVVIEHENVRQLSAFQFDHWKTLCADAPLRVAIGYAPKASDRGKWVSVINREARSSANGWRSKSGTEDLIALGYNGMSSPGGNFQFWRRVDPSKEWSLLPTK